MLREIDSDELAEWHAFDRLEPFGNTAYGADWRNALLISHLSNVFSRKQLYQIKDFMPDHHLLERKPEKKQDPEMIKAMLIGALQPTTGKRKRSKKKPRPKRPKRG